MDYPIIFDGKAFAASREKALADKLFDMKKNGKFLVPKLNIMMVGESRASELYVTKKKEAAERVGIDVEVFSVPHIQREASYLKTLIKHMNDDPSVHGIMIQLPLPPKYKKDQQDILNTIAPHKDVDGLGENSEYEAATARSILSIVDEARKVVAIPDEPFVLVAGASGTVGRATIKAFEKRGYTNVNGVDKVGEIIRKKISTKLTTQADILVSATGVPFLIRNRNVKPHAVVIDVGSPKPDVEIEGVSQRADFITPVPGGVGPLTVISLLENVFDAAIKANNIKV